MILRHIQNSGVEYTFYTKISLCTQKTLLTRSHISDLLNRGLAAESFIHADRFNPMKHKTKAECESERLDKRLERGGAYEEAERLHKLLHNNSK